LSQYNGWTNYETWRINLEMLDGMSLEDMGFRRAEFLDEYRRDQFTDRLAADLEAYVCDIVEADAKGFALDLAQSFLAKVDWDEIAEHMVADSIAEYV
jgi:hypothetical protein